MSKQILDGDTVATIIPIFFGALVAVMREKNKQRTPFTWGTGDYWSAIGTYEAT